MHFVGDNHNGLAAVPHIAQDAEQLFRLLGGKDGGRLVQNQNFSPTVQHLHNFHRLLLGHGHIVNLLVGVYIKAIGVADFLNLLPGFLQIQPSGQTQHNVLGGGQHIHQLEMLVNHANAMGKGILGRGDNHLFVIDENIAGIREIDAGEHIHQGGLAASVFTQQCQNFSPVNIQPDPVIGKHRAKGFCDVAHLHRRNFVALGWTHHRLFFLFQKFHTPILVTLRTLYGYITSLTRPATIVIQNNNMVWDAAEIVIW